ncbi:sulfite oxidase-like oxidoreductase [Bacillus taeanensis]|uniref:Sulfite oxidase-like oxidoreductase n=1 Tax=Bacillus taeanensis TaxID=273032 RepID=A0A366Y524_9BACI|nr:sulfite oxidase-like oxidoreductase [Bacillus taeanensis]RBW71311.1 sulfite oxidase-like oxidoreductase [Bacillus taeanensis]
MFFGSKRKEKNNDRLPPNQRLTEGWPVLHHGNVPYYKSLEKWDLKIFGCVQQNKELTFNELMNYPQIQVRNDIHCVTGWSKFDNVWEGVSVKALIEDMSLLPEANYVILHAEEGWTTNLPIEDFLRETSLLAHSHSGERLTPEHGFPLRAVVPHLYFWKSAKWLRGIEFAASNTPGFWERNGYHMYGDPFKEERFSWD